MQKVSIAWRPDYAARMHGMQASEIRELLKIAERADVVSFAGGIPEPGAVFRSTASARPATASSAIRPPPTGRCKYSVKRG